ncbi:hypothetical protein CI102_11171 [Trichoderma harzianum]|nr:hypothetical protein CI102_11171 [Trichoderma harzianum]
MQCGSALLKARCEEITTEIAKVVKGMFLLAQLYFETIKTKERLKQFKNTLEKLPTGQKAYDFAYEEAIWRIKGLDPDSKELAWLVLSWITCAKRPFATKELQHVLAVEVGKAELDEENFVEIEDMVSPLWYAAQNGYEALVKLLLASGAIVNTTDMFGESALSVAARIGHQGIVEALLAAGADINAGTGFAKETALLEAAVSGHQGIVEALLAAGANVTFDNRWGRTVHIVKIAAKRGYQEIVEKLLAAGAQQ